MIKINLASRKQPVAAAEPGGQTGTIAGFTRAFEWNTIRELPLWSVALVVVVYFLSNSFFSGMRDKALAEVQVKISAARARTDQLSVEIEKTRTYDKDKADLLKNRDTIKNKVDTIDKLLNDRQVPPRMLKVLAEAVPTDVWLTNFSVKDSSVVIEGAAVDYNLISDFLKKLGETSYFIDMNLESSQKVGDEKGLSVVKFLLKGKRKMP